MREILFRGKTSDGEWLEGYLNQHRGRVIFDCCCNAINANDYYINDWTEKLDTDLYGCVYKVDPETVGQYTGLTDKNGRKIFEGDIVQYNIYDDFDCQSVVKFGEYNQDGSAGEYSARECIGFYVDVDNFTCPDWCENNPDYFPKHFIQQNVLEIARDCQVIGNIHDNPEILEGGGDNG